MNKTLSVSAIKDGTVIDHIPAGQAIKIMRLLRLANTHEQVTVGLNLLSQSMGLKDLIKLKNKFFTKEEANQIILFAPNATINVIEDFIVTKKVNTELPHIISNILICPNPRCITHPQHIPSCFHIEKEGKNISLTCKYCEKKFDRDRLIKED